MINKSKDFIDISWPLRPEITGYKDKQSLAIEAIKNFSEHGVRESLIRINSHAGTHIDAPSHFIKDGKTIDQIILEQCIGICRVIEIDTAIINITKEVLVAQAIKKYERILFKTRNSARSATAPFDGAFTYLTKEAADYLASLEILLVGIDYLGIERNQPHHETHRAFLENNIVILEGLRLQDITPGSYELICLPLALQEIDAAPARAILRPIRDGDKQH